MMKTSRIALLPVLVLLCCLCFDVNATTVLSVNVADLSAAKLIFTGTCTRAERRQMALPGGKGSIEAVTYTFSVPREGVIKGEVPDTFSFNQAVIKGVPVYEAGGEYTLCLSYESPWGLRTTIGLGQGKFNVVTGADGKKQLVNDMGNKGLFTNLPATPSVAKALGAAKVSPGSPEAEGPIDYDKFVEMMKELNK